jgi:hypothetical protein
MVRSMFIVSTLPEKTAIKGKVGKVCNSDWILFSRVADADPGSASHQSDANLPPLVYRPSTAPF